MLSPEPAAPGGVPEPPRVVTPPCPPPRDNVYRVSLEPGTGSELRYHRVSTEPPGGFGELGGGDRYGDIPRIPQRDLSPQGEVMGTGTCLKGTP